MPQKLLHLIPHLWETEMIGMRAGPSPSASHLNARSQRCAVRRKFRRINGAAAEGLPVVGPGSVLAVCGRAAPSA